MSLPVMALHLFMEALSRNTQVRVPEADLVMQEVTQVAAFAESGGEAGMLADIYLFHAVMSLPVIRPGDIVLDLACGPAIQLAQIAQFHPDVQFIGLDASPKMLEIAGRTIAEAALGNVTLQQGDMTRLTNHQDQSIDCVTCTMSLHHLGDVPQLHATMREIRRVLKPGGGLYLADFGRLKRSATQRYFAYDRKEWQSEQFTADFLASIMAAFSTAEFDTALQAHNLTDVSRYTTAVAPFMVIYRSRQSRRTEPCPRDAIKRRFAALTKQQQRDFVNVTRWFRLGGLNLPFGVY